jgi:hypothetical protein
VPEIAERIEPTPWERILRLLYNRLSQEPVTWALTGSLALALRGLKVREPGDVDIQTDAAGAYAIERLWASDMQRPVTFSEAERIRSHFGALEIDGVVVEIMGDIQHRLPDGRWSEPVNIAAEREWLEVDGMRLPLLLLAHEAVAYRRLGRLQRAALIEAHLNSRDPNDPEAH